LRELRVDIRKMHKAKVAAIGPKTAELLEEKGLVVEVLPQEFRAEGLLDSLEEHLQKGQKVLLPRADIARKILPEKLKAKGLEVVEIDAYETIVDAENKIEIIEMLKIRRFTQSPLPVPQQLLTLLKRWKARILPSCFKT